VLPDIPPLADFLPGYDVSGWFGIGAPKNTPAEIVERLNKEINAGLADPKIKARLADLGAALIAASMPAPPTSCGNCCAPSRLMRPAV